MFMHPVSALVSIGILASALSLLSGCLPGSLEQPSAKQLADQERIEKLLGHPRLIEALRRRMQLPVICVVARFSSANPDPSQPTLYLFQFGEPSISSDHLKALNRDKEIALEELTKALGKPPKNYKFLLVAGAEEPPTCQELMQAQS